MNHFTKPMEDLGTNVREYIDLRVDDLKLRTVKGLSLSLNHLLAMILILFSGSIVLLAVAFGIILLLGQLLGSYAGGAFIVAVIFAILTFILWKLKGKLFQNSFVKLFIKLFFDEEEDEEEDVQPTEIVKP